MDDLTGVEDVSKEVSELSEGFKKVKKFYKERLADKEWVVHCIGIVITIPLFASGHHLMGFISFILLVPDTEDILRYMRFEKEEKKNTIQI